MSGPAKPITLADDPLAPYFIAPGWQVGNLLFLSGQASIGADGSIGPSKRMKEVRYMRKWTAFSKRTYARHYELGGFEKEAGALPRPTLGYWRLGSLGPRRLAQR